MEVGVDVDIAVGAAVADGMPGDGVAASAVTVGEAVLSPGVDGDGVGSIAVTDGTALMVTDTEGVAIVREIVAGTTDDVGLVVGTALGAVLVDGSSVSEGNGVSIASGGVDVGSTTVSTAVDALGDVAGVVRGSVVGSDVSGLAVGNAANWVLAVGVTVEIAASGVVAGGVVATVSADDGRTSGVVGPRVADGPDGTRVGNGATVG
jgi:hypothetical protein